MVELVIFVGGIHGVGKTTFCQQLAIQTAMRHRAVSDIIKDESGSIDFDTSKESDNLEINQRALTNWLEKNRNCHRMLLDGHFTLLNKAQEFYNVGVDVFERICPAGIICLESPVDLVISRLQKRDGKIWPRDLVGNMADNERNRAELVADTLRIPICIISSHDILSAKRFVNGLME